MTTLRNDNGQRMTVKASHRGDQGVKQALNAVRIEQERLAAWQRLDDPERHMVQAVVRASLRRLLEDPRWIPASVRLGRDRLDVFIVVELDVDQVEAAAAAADLDLALAISRQELAEALQALGAGDDGPPA